LYIAVLSGGKNIVANVREGDSFDLSVKFTGVEPFSFTYRRISTTEDGLVLVESKQVNNISSHEYHFPTESAGTYELISVADRFCRF
jgi:nucleoporin POM152